MLRSKWQLIIVLAFILSAVLSACSFSASTANIKEANLAKDAEGTQVTTVFAQDEPFYCVVDLANAPDDTTVKATWTAVNVEGEEANTFIDEKEVTTGDNTIQFDLTNNGAWPVGTYKVDLYLNGSLDRTLEFSVE